MFQVWGKGGIEKGGRIGIWDVGCKRGFSKDLSVTALTENLVPINFILYSGWKELYINFGEWEGIFRVNKNHRLEFEGL